MVNMEDEQRPSDQVLTGEQNVVADEQNVLQINI